MPTIVLQPAPGPGHLFVVAVHKSPNANPPDQYGAHVVLGFGVRKNLTLEAGQVYTFTLEQISQQGGWHDPTWRVPRPFDTHYEQGVFDRSQLDASFTRTNLRDGLIEFYYPVEVLYPFNYPGRNQSYEFKLIQESGRSSGREPDDPQWMYVELACVATKGTPNPGDELSCWDSGAPFSYLVLNEAAFNLEGGPYVIPPLVKEGLKVRW